MLRRLFLLALLASATPSLHAWIYWEVATVNGTYYPGSGTISIPSGSTYTVNCWGEAGTVSITRNGGFVANDSYQSADAGPTTIDFGLTCEGWVMRDSDWSGEGGGQVSVYIYETDGFSITVQPVPNQPPFGYVDAPTASTFPRSQSLTVSGWAVDTDTGAPVTRVDLLIDNTDVGDASLGQPRGDVASAYGRSDFQNSGWSASLNLSAFTPGTHTLTVVAVDAMGATTVIGTRNLVFYNYTPPTTSLWSSVSSLTLGGSFTLNSYASDSSSDLTDHWVESLAPGSSTWTSFQSWSGGSTANNTLSRAYTPDSAGTWQFRSRGADAYGTVGGFSYLNLTVNMPSPTLDSDGDGMPDIWEMGFGLDRYSAADASSDNDGDGLSNLAEYQAGKNPNNPADGATGLQLILRTAPGQHHSVNTANWLISPL